MNVNFKEIRENARKTHRFRRSKLWPAHYLRKDNLSNFSSILVELTSIVIRKNFMSGGKKFPHSTETHRFLKDENGNAKRAQYYFGDEIRYLEQR